MRLGESIEVDCQWADPDADLSVGAPEVGLYAELQGVTIGLFALGGGLFLWLDGEVLGFGNDLAVDHDATGARSRLVGPQRPKQPRRGVQDGGPHIDHLLLRG